VGRTCRTSGVGGIHVVVALDIPVVSMVGRTVVHVAVRAGVVRTESILVEDTVVADRQ